MVKGLEIYFYQKSRHIKCEVATRDYKIWEEMDGMHTLDTDAILKDEVNLYSPKIIFFDDMICPLGSKQSKNRINQLFNWINLIKNNGGKISISNIKSRAWFKLIQKYLPYIILFGLFAVALIISSSG